MPDDAIERARARELLKRAFLARSIGYVDLPTSNLVSIACAIDALLLAFASQQAPEGWRPISHELALAAGNLVVATDGIETLRDKRQLVLDRLNNLAAMLDAAPSVTLGEVG